MTTAEEELQTASALVAFRAPANLVAALDQATADDMCSRSDVARRALLDHLRQRGLLRKSRTNTVCDDGSQRPTRALQYQSGINVDAI
jgi:hypothetical protein